MRRVSIILALIVTTGIAAGAGQGDPPDVQPLALVITYADGRAVSTLIGSRPHRSWTPTFPRISSWQPPARSLPANAIQYASLREGDDVRVTVSVLFGQPHQKEEEVDQVVVRAGGQVQVTALRRFGIEPVRMSLSPVGSLALHPPTVESRVAGLTIEQVEPMTGVPPRYRITVTNHSSVAAAAFQIESFRDGRPALSKREWDARAISIVASGERHTFDLPLLGGLVRGDQPISTEPLDTIILTSVVWDDGTIEGNRRPAAHVRLSYAGQRAQLAKVIAVLEAAVRQAKRKPATVIERLRQATEELPIDRSPQQMAQALARVPAGAVPEIEAEAIVRTGMQRVKDLVRQDLEAIALDGGAKVVQRQLSEMLAEYRAWRTRLEP